LLKTSRIFSGGRGEEKICRVTSYCKQATSSHMCCSNLLHVLRLPRHLSIFPFVLCTAVKYYFNTIVCEVRFMNLSAQSL